MNMPPLLSLPSLLKTTLETIPASIPYLFADPDLAKHGGMSWPRFPASRSASPGMVTCGTPTIASVPFP